MTSDIYRRLLSESARLQAARSLQTMLTILRRSRTPLPRRRLSAFVVFAKTGGFSDAEIEACARAQARSHERVILLSKDELEPYDIFERHAGADRMMKAQGLEGLANFTTQRFPKLRPEGFRTIRA